VICENRFALNKAAGYLKRLESEGSLISAPGLRMIVPISQNNKHDV